MNRSPTSGHLSLKLTHYQKGWSQMKMAQLAGLDDRYLGSIERGEIDASLSTLDKIARTLRTTVSQLFQNAATPFHGRL